jgi:GcrA cell cycle regulator
MALWTDEQTDLLRKLYAEGFSFSQIAGQLACGFSRNAVIGRASRLNLNDRPRPKAESKGPRIRSPKPRMRLAKVIQAAAEIFQPQIADVISRRMSILEVRDNECHYADPEGDPVNNIPHTFCGHPTLDGASYCYAHQLICLGSGTRSEQSAVRSGIAAAEREAA